MRNTLHVTRNYFETKQKKRTFFALLINHDPFAPLGLTKFLFLESGLFSRKQGTASFFCSRSSTKCDPERLYKPLSIMSSCPSLFQLSSVCLFLRIINFAFTGTFFSTHAYHCNVYFLSFPRLSIHQFYLFIYTYALD